MKEAMGDIGEPQRHITFEPLPDSVPAPEPTTAPAEPVYVPEPEPEKVGA